MKINDDDDDDSSKTNNRIRTQLSECREKFKIVWIASLISVV